MRTKKWTLIITVLLPLLVLGLTGCGLNWERLTHTWFEPWDGQNPETADLRQGDVVLRFMDTPQAVALAGLWQGHFSHAGLVIIRNGQPWILDCLGLDPRSAIKAEPMSDFLAGKRYANKVTVSRLGPLPINYTFDVNYREYSVHYLVLRFQKPLDSQRFAAVLDEYVKAPTDYDYDYLLDNDTPERRRYYCTEFVWRFLQDVTGEDLAVPFQTRETTLENIALVENMVFKQDVLDAVKQRYGEHFVDFMVKVGQHDKKTIAALPPGSRIITPDAFLMSPKFHIVDYQVARRAEYAHNVFLRHFQQFIALADEWKRRFVPVSGVVVDPHQELAAKNAPADDPLYYLRDFLLRPVNSAGNPSADGLFFSPVTGRPAMTANRNSQIY